jgi:hypothetical protein
MLRTAADLVRTLQAGTYALADVYAMAEAGGLADQPGADRDAGDGQPVWKRRVRTALYAAHAKGRVRCERDGRQAAWLVDGTPELPRRALLVWLPAERGAAELVLGKAVDILGQVEEPIDLIVADPPYALGRGRADSAYRRVYQRDHTLVMPGYVEVEPEQYADFTAEWVTAAAQAIRPGGYLAVVTGPEQAARVQVTAQDIAGLTYVNSIPVRRRFGVYCTRRFVHAHWVISLLTRGPLDSPARVFDRPQESPRGRTGQLYAEDVWDDIPVQQRPGLLRYDNALPVMIPSRLIRSTTRPGDLVCDPFLGSGTTLAACLHTGRRFHGGDENPDALRFTMARILAEVLPEVNAAAVAATDQWVQLMLGS